MQIDFFERLEKYADARPGEVALQVVSGDGREELTWHELVNDVRRFGARLQATLASRPVPCHVGLLMEDSPRWGVSFIAAYSAGCVIVPLDASQNAESLAGVVVHSECEALIFSKRYAEVARLAAEVRPGLILLDDSIPATATEHELPLVKRDPDDDLVILYTGGTTGSPKGVRLTGTNLFRSVLDMLTVCPVTAEDNVLSILPLFHVMAILASLLGPLYVGGKVTYLATRDPARVLAAFAEQGVTGMLCVPQFYYLMVRRILEQVETQSAVRQFAFYRLLNLSRFLRRRLHIQVGRVLLRPVHERFGPKFRLFGVGAASFAPETAEMMLDLGFSLFQAYGLTETTGPVTVDPPGVNGGLTCGPPFPHSRVRINQPGPDGIGEILIAGEQLTPGYWKNPEATVELIRDGWLWSGDLGFLDASGKLHVTGRRKEVIVLSSGKNVFPEPVEYQIQKGSQFIRELCVVSASDDSGEHLHAVIVPDFDRLREKGISSVQDQIRYDVENASRSLASWQRVRSFEIRDTPLPRTSTRKLKRLEVRPRFTSSAARRAEWETPAEEPEVFTLIRRIKKNSGVITADTHLELDLGLDSLERVELLSNIRARFGVEISDEQAGRMSTAGDLAKAVESATPVAEGRWISWQEILNTPLSEEQRLTASLYLKRRPVLEAALFIACRLVGLVAKLPLQPGVSGAEEIPREGSFILCSNHASYLDTPLIAAALPFPVFQRLFFLGARKYQRTLVQRWLARLIRGMTVDSSAYASGALRLAAEGLRGGFVLCVFPEGHRSIDGSLLPFHHGPSILSVVKNVPIVPVGISGTQKVWGRGARRIQPHPVTVRFGQLIRRDESPDYERLTARVRQAIADLIQPETRML